MRIPFLCTAICGLCLSACTQNIDKTVNDVVLTASGRVTEVKDRVHNAAAPIIETINNINKRAQKIKEGFSAIQDGAAILQDAVGD